MRLKKQPLVAALLSAFACLGQTGQASAAGDTLSLGALAGDVGNYYATTWSAMSADGRYVTLTATAQYIQHVHLYDRFTGLVSDLTPTANSTCTASDISADGRYVVFMSAASNLGPEDSNGMQDIYLLDRNTGTYSLVSQSAAGVIGDNHSYYAAVSDDGRYVVFSSTASNLVDDDTNGLADLFLRDMKTGRVTRLSVPVNGDEAESGLTATAGGGIAEISGDGRYVAFIAPGKLSAEVDENSTDVFVADTVTGEIEMISKHVRTGSGVYMGDSKFQSMSSDARYIAFHSGSGQLIQGDSDDFITDIFLYDRLTGEMRKVTTGANGNSMMPRVSRDGRFVAFVSQASNLVPDDTNNTWDSFLYDRTSGAITRVNVTADGAQSAGDGYYPGSRPALSADGRFVAFESGAKDLTPDDSDSAATDVFLRDTQALTTRANVGVAVTAPTNAQKGVAYDYQITVSNAGPRLAKLTTAIITLPPSLNVLNVTPTQGSCKKGGVTVCRLGILQAGGQATLWVRVQPTALGKVTVSATAESVAQDGKMGNNTVKRTVTVVR